MKLLNCATACFFGVFLSLGLIVFSRWTLSANAYTHGLLPFQSCQLSNDWNCHDRKETSSVILDTGAVAWVEISDSLFSFNNKSADWNPYIGSGFPQFLDGHNRKTGLSNITMSTFQSENGRDILIFLRFFIWSLGFVLILDLYKIGFFSKVAIAFLSTKIPFVSVYVDHVFLDVDMLAPLLIYLLNSVMGKATKKSYFLSTAIGLYIGFQSFLQSQVVILFVSLVFLILNLKNRSLSQFVVKTSLSS